MSELAFTRFDARSPTVLTKRFALADDGTLTKTSVAQMTHGRATLCHAADLVAFAETLDSLPPSAALAYGVAPGYPTARVVAQKHHRDGDGAITRTRRYLQFAPGPGLKMLDHDPRPGSKAMSADELIEALRGAAPVLAGASMLWRPSVSSGIRTIDGRELTGLKGQRIYIPVQDTSVIPKAGAALVNLLWAAGHGYIQIGAAGQMLPRTLIDSTVWQPERLDFTAPPILGPGLVREPPEHRVIGNPAGRFDLKRLIELADGSVQATAAKARQVAQDAAKLDAQAAQEAWVEEHAPALAQARGISLEAAQCVLRTAASTRVLSGDFLLHADDGQEVSVGELLDAPERWHGRRFGDPLEPGYGNDARIAWANLRSGGRPHIYSHAHGGRRFHLLRPSAKIKLGTGERARIVDNLLDLLRERRELYDFGEGAALARISDDARVLPVTRDWLVDHFERVARFYTLRLLPGTQAHEEIPGTPPPGPPPP